MLIKKMLSGAVLAITAVILAACAGPTDPVVVTRVVENVVTRPISPPEIEVTEPVEVTRPTPEPTAAPVEPSPLSVQTGATFDGYLTEDIPTLDPQIAQDNISIDYIENLFVSLTNHDLITSEIVPEAATSWEISDDGLEYTFHLRTDIPWVNHNPVTGDTSQETDEEGNPRFVTAHDFAYGIRRACDPTIAAYYSGIIAPLIVGCEELLNSAAPTEQLTDAIGVEAIDEATLVIKLNFPASYFLSMTPMWTLAAAPEWAIIEYGRYWSEAGTIVTSGPYVLHEWIHSIRTTLIRNPLMPEDMQGAGNIEKLVAEVIPDPDTGYALWLNNEVDIADIPALDVQKHLDDFSNETIQISDQAVFYIGFRTTKPPFDDVRVRRAFGAAFDRETFVDEVLQGNGLPMSHFAPPGIFGAPPIGEVGLVFDPDFAQAELAAAGYPDCEGFPEVVLAAYSGQFTLNWVEFAQEQWQEHLGCSADKIQFTQFAFTDLLDITAFETADAEAAHMFTLGWGPNYADETNWVGDVLSCDTSDNRAKRTCNEIDDMIVEAGQEHDPARRIELYAQIEEAFFGPEGEYPIMPIYVRTAFKAVHSWYDYTPALFGGDQWYNSSIDMEAKQAARGY